MGKDGPDEAPPLKWRTERVGPERRRVRVSDGIDPGFAHAPGRLAHLGEVVRHRMRRSIQQPPGIASVGVAEVLPLPRALSVLSEEWRRWRRSDGAAEDHQFELGALLDQVLDELDALGIAPSSTIVTIARKELAHAARRAKAMRGAALDDVDWDRLPVIVANPDAVLLHQEGERAKPGRHVLLLVFSPAHRRDNKGKIAVRLDYRVRRRGETSISNSVRSAGYVMPENLRAPHYQVLSGESN